jgi:FHS family L-fucose permease-like MFS transporter
MITKFLSIFIDVIRYFILHILQEKKTMLEIHLSGEILSSPSTSSLLPSSNIDENLHIVLSNNGRFEIVSSLWTLIFSDKRLRSLSLVNLQLNQNDAFSLARYFHEQNYLIKLTIDSVRGTMDMFNHIINEGLQNNASIRRLNLSNAENLNATAIANLIKNNKHIESLFLKRNNLSENDATIIADALRLNTKLKSIDLSHNHINKTGALAFGNLCQQRHSSLTHINLIDNNIDNETQQNIRSQCQNLIHITFSTETEPIVKQSLTTINSTKKKSQYVPIIFVTFLFFLWGVPHQLNNVLIHQFMKLFVLSRFEAGLIQSTFFMGYFVLALPAAYVLRRWGYKLGIILGFVLFGTGSFLFWPAALTGQYPPFLLALFVIATGVAFLETAANPYIANAAGPMETSEKRLTLAQAFNPLGTITGAVMGTFLIFSDIDLNENEIKQMRERKTYDDYLKHETLRAVQPYAILGGVSFLSAILIAMVTFPTHTKIDKINENNLYRRVYLVSIIAQFGYVGAQVGTWSYFMQYVQDYVEVGEQISSYLLTGTFALFAIGRLTAALFMHYGYSPSMLLATCSFINVLLIGITVFVPNSIGVGALLFTSFFMGPMFPTIFALGIKDMNESTTIIASCFLVMACIGGAIYPPLMGLISVKSKRLSLAYTLPGGAYIIVGIFALLAYKLTTKKPNKSYI